MFTKNLVSKELDKGLSLLGFAKKKNRWYRDLAGGRQVCELQWSQWSAKAYINLGFCPVEMPWLSDVTEICKCAAGYRLDKLFPESALAIGAALDLERATPDNNRLADIQNSILEPIVLWFAKIVSLEALEGVIASEPFSQGFVTKQLQEIIQQRRAEYVNGDKYEDPERG